MAVKRDARGGYIVVKRTGKWKVRRATGLQASDLTAALEDRAEMQRQRPRMDQPRRMIEGVRVVGQDKLTATDGAMYILLLALCRDQGLERGVYELPLHVAKGYLGIVRTDRIIESLDRLGSTICRYDLREADDNVHGTAPLVIAETRTPRADPDGRGIITFEIPQRVRQIMQAANSWAMVDLSYFPRFKCRYTHRLYQRLAYEAGKSPELIRPLTFTPVELAEALGYPLTGKAKTLAYSDFRKRCLEPVRRDLKIVDRFETTMHECVADSEDVAAGRVATARGGKVMQISITVTPARKLRVQELPAGKLDPLDALAMGMDDPRLPARLCPTPRGVARVWREIVGSLSHGCGLTPEALATAFKARMDKRSAFQFYALVDDGSMTADDALRFWARQGLEDGWVERLHKMPGRDADVLRAEAAAFERLMRERSGRAERPRVREDVSLPFRDPARARARIINKGLDMLDDLEGYERGSSWMRCRYKLQDVSVMSYLDEEVTLWLDLPEAVRAQLGRAFRKMHASEHYDIDRIKRTLHALGEAMALADESKRNRRLMDVSWAVLQSQGPAPVKEDEKKPGPKGKPALPPRPRLRRPQPTPAPAPALADDCPF